MHNRVITRIIIKDVHHKETGRDRAIVNCVLDDERLLRKFNHWRKFSMCPRNKDSEYYCLSDDILYFAEEFGIKIVEEHLRLFEDDDRYRVDVEYVIEHA